MEQEKTWQETRAILLDQYRLVLLLVNMNAIAHANTAPVTRNLLFHLITLNPNLCFLWISLNYFHLVTRMVRSHLSTNINTVGGSQF